MVALSGVYDTDYFWGDWMNPVLYRSAPLRFLPNMPADHPYIDLYNARSMVFCVGQGAYEDEGRRTLSLLRDIFREKGVNACVDFWGYDVNHDWPWWFRQMRHFLPQVLD